MGSIYVSETFLVSIWIRNSIQCYQFTAAPHILVLNPPMMKFHYCIQFEVAGYPIPEISWLHNGKTLTKKSTVYTFYSEQPKPIYKTTGCLIFEMKNAKNNGIYTLIAKNEFGADERTVKADFMVGSAALSGRFMH